MKEKRIHTIGDKDYWYFPKIKNKPNKLDKILKELQEMLITLKKIEDGSHFHGGKNNG